MKKKFQSVEEKCVRDVLLAADVIVSTCIGAGVSDTMIKMQHSIYDNKNHIVEWNGVRYRIKYNRTGQDGGERE